MAFTTVSVGTDITFVIVKNFIKKNLPNVDTM